MALIVLAGCASTPTVHRPSADVVRSLPRPAPAVTPAATIAVTVEEPDGISPLADAIAESLAGALAAEGYAAPETGAADAALACTLHEAGVTRTRRFSDARSYRIAAECTLSRGGEPVWHDTVTQRYEERVFVNTMSKLPSGDDATWLQECLVPWQRLVVWRTARAIQRPREKSTASPSADAAPAAGAAVKPPPAGSFQK